MKIAFNKKTDISFLVAITFDWIKKKIRMKVSASKYALSRIIHMLNWIGVKFSVALLLQMMFDWTKKTIICSYEVWTWLHQKYGISRIMQKFHSMETKHCAFTLILPRSFDWIFKTMNDSDEVLLWVHIKYRMSQIVNKIYIVV